MDGFRVAVNRRDPPIQPSMKIMKSGLPFQPNRTGQLPIIVLVRTRPVHALGTAEWGRLRIYGWRAVIIEKLADERTRHLHTARSKQRSFLR